MKSFWLSFVPMFVAVDAVGVLPMYLGLTEGLEPSRVRRVLYQSIVTAAAVALVMWVSWPDERSRLAEVAPLASAAPADPRDIDRDGRVDILDAFALARRLEGTDAPADNWDMNGDGVVDQGDVDSVAMAAVSLKGEAL